MFNLVIFGGPGSGKGTQSEKLIDRYGLTHISTGEVLRGEIAAGTELGKIADGYISRGQLIPDDLMVRVLASVLDDNPEKTSKGVIFDGFPRTIPQAESLKKMLAERGSEVHAVIGLEVPEEELIRRMLQRGKETGRADDNIDTITKRLKVYHEQTAPLREYYKQEGNYLPVEGSGDVDRIFFDIKTRINERT